MKIWGLILLACLAANRKKCDPVNDAATLQLLPDYSGGELRLHRPPGVYMAGAEERADDGSYGVLEINPKP